MKYSLDKVTLLLACFFCSFILFPFHIYFLFSLVLN